MYLLLDEKKKKMFTIHLLSIIIILTTSSTNSSTTSSPTTTSNNNNNQCPTQYSILPSSPLPYAIQSNNVNNPTTLTCPCQGNANHQSMWRFIPTTTGYYVIDTLGSNFDTVLLIMDDTYTNVLACNDDWIGTTQSWDVVYLLANQPIRIVVFGFAQYAMGQFNLRIDKQGPTMSPTIGSCPTQYRTIGNSTASRQQQQIIGMFDSTTAIPLSTMPSCQANVQGVGGLVFRYVSNPSSSLGSTITIDTIGSSFDTVLVAYSGDSSCSVELNCADDYSGSSQSVLQLTTTSSSSIYIYLFGYQNSQGPYVLNIRSGLYFPPIISNVTVYRIQHGLCYGTFCECDPGWIGNLCTTQSSTTTMPTTTVAVIDNRLGIIPLAILIVPFIFLGIVYGIIQWRINEKAKQEI
jgi:hypothetical protein